jgi:tetrapyrrole methylase family protein/MazG family protein
MTRQEKRDSFRQLVDIIRRLRSQDGCPWDRRQTAATLKKYLLEESGELAEAIDSGRMDAIREETGDLLYILILLSLIHEEKGHFTLDETLDAIAGKMIRRHPHVFAGREAGDEAEMRRQWHEIKAGEK